MSVGSSSSTLRMLDDSDWQYENLCDLFHTRWLKPQPARGVSVVRIFSIQVQVPPFNGKWTSLKKRLSYRI